jgi:hypothetical protein
VSPTQVASTTIIHVSGGTIQSTGASVIQNCGDLAWYLESTFGRTLPTPYDEETAEILADPEFVVSINRALAQADRGEGRPWREVFAELD